MNSKLIDFKGTVSNYSNKTIEQPNNREILEKKKNLYAQLQVNKQGNDETGNFHFHVEALKVADLIFT